MSLHRGTAIASEILRYYDVTNRAGFGKAQIWILLCTGFQVMHVFSELMGMAVISPAVQCDFEMTEIMKSILHSAGLVGVIVSSFFWNILADIKGRKWVMIYSSGGAILISLISSLMPNYISFVSLRFFVGIFIAGTSFSAITYLVEFCPFKHRPVVINYMAMFNGICMIYCPALAQCFVCCDWTYPLGFITYRTWRFIMLLFTLPGLVGICLLWKLPESPEYLFLTNEIEEVRKIHQWIFKLNLKIHVKLYDLPQVETAHSPTIFPAFERAYILPFLLSLFLMFVLFGLGQGLGIWFTDLRNRQLRDPKDELIPKTLCEEMSLYGHRHLALGQCIDKVKSYRDSIILGLGFIITYNIMGLLLHRFTRKYILTVSLIICVISGIGLLYLSLKLAIVADLILFLALPNVLINLVSSTVIDFTASRDRGKIMCLCFMMGRLGSIHGSFLVGSLLESQCEWVFFAFTLLMFAAAIASFTLFRVLDKIVIRR